MPLSPQYDATKFLQSYPSFLLSSLVPWLSRKGPRPTSNPLGSVPRAYDSLPNILGMLMTPTTLLYLENLLEGELNPSKDPCGTSYAPHELVKTVVASSSLRYLLTKGIVSLQETPSGLPLPHASAKMEKLSLLRDPTKSTRLLQATMILHKEKSAPR
jgi:hypothetical protein